LTISLFEPDPRSAITLRKSGYNVFEFGLSDSERDLDLLMTKKPECSSVLKPNLKNINLYPDSERFSVVDICKIPCKTLDGIDFLEVDFMKIDVQGHELAVLKGAREKLRKCLGVEVEVYFRAFYENQPLFAEIDTFLRSCGFELMDIKNQKYFARDGYYGAGELIFGDAIYVKDINHVNSDEIEVIHKLFTINFAYENFSTAEKIISGNIDHVIRELRLQEKVNLAFFCESFG